MLQSSRKQFLRLTGLSTLAALTPSRWLRAQQPDRKPPPSGSARRVFLINDGLHLTAPEYLDLLQVAQRRLPVERDSYGSGGTTELLAQRFASLTGKEDALYVPTGTMANQLALQLLQGPGTRSIYALPNSHVCHDEVAAASAFGNRIVPVAGSEFSLQPGALEDAGAKPGGAVVSVELPVRLALHRMPSFADLHALKTWCNDRRIPMHLDGARLPLAGAWAAVPWTQYTQFFDTVYISLFKCFGASGGAVLCGSKDLVADARARLKAQGGSIYTSFPETAMALYQLDGLHDRLVQSRQKAESLFTQLNALGDDLHIQSVANGTNKYTVTLSPRIHRERLINRLMQRYNVRPGDLETVKVNETLLRQSNAELVVAFEEALTYARG